MGPQYAIYSVYRVKPSSYPVESCFALLSRTNNCVNFLLQDDIRSVLKSQEPVTMLVSPHHIIRRGIQTGS
jgi:hypothetical protein